MPPAPPFRFPRPARPWPHPAKSPARPSRWRGQWRCAAAHRRRAGSRFPRSGYGSPPAAWIQRRRTAPPLPPPAPPRRWRPACRGGCFPSRCRQTAPHPEIRWRSFSAVPRRPPWTRPRRPAAPFPLPDPRSGLPAWLPWTCRRRRVPPAPSPAPASP